MSDEIKESRTGQLGEPEEEVPFLDEAGFPTPRDLKEILSYSGKTRLEMILQSSDPAELVSLLPETDLFITIKEVGLGDALELIGLATPEQIIHFLDLDLWKKDRLEPERFLPWLEALESCGEETLRRFVEAADPELLISLFQNCLRVTLEEERDEDQGTKPEKKGFTLDRIYYVDFLRREDAPLLIKILKGLNAHDPERYQNLLDALVRVIPAEEEEAALRWRRGRLADRGFPDFYEAQELYGYRPIRPAEEEAPLLEVSTDPSFSPPGYLEASGKGSFIFRALQGAVIEEQRQRIELELIHLANQVLVADGAEPGDPEAILESTRRAFQTLDLGLRQASGEDLNKAARMLERLPIVRIFQAGFSLGLELKFKAEKIFRKGVGLGALEGREELLDSPFRETVKGLLIKKPLFHDPNIPGGYRPFLSLSDLGEVRNLLQRLASLSDWLFYRLAITAEEMNTLRRRQLSHPDPTIGAVLLTLLGQGILKGRPVLEPLTLEDVNRLKLVPFRSTPGEGRSRQAAGAVDFWLNPVRETFGDLSLDGIEALRWWVSFSLNRLEEELGRIPSDGEVDPRYLSLLLIAPF